MSQTWIPNTSGELDSTDTLSDSRTYLNDALEALRSSFSGTASPSSPVAGQLFLDTDDNLLYMWNGASWAVLGDIDLNYLGALARQGGASYAMGGDLYMGTHQIKGVTDPTLSTDASTKNYGDTTYLAKAGGTMVGDITCGANNITMDHNPTLSTHLARKAYVDLFDPLVGSTWTGNHGAGGYKLTGLGTPTATADATTKSYVDGKFDPSTGHDHDTSDSKKVLWTNLDTTGATAGQLLAADGSNGAVVRNFSAVATYLSTGFATGWDAWVTAIETPSIVLVSGAHVAISVSWWAGSGSANFRIDRVTGGTPTTIVASRTSSSPGDGFSYVDTSPGAATYTYRLSAYGLGGAGTTIRGHMLVHEVG